MIIDSSALLAIFFEEPEADLFESVIAANRCRMSVANALESTIVVGRRIGSGATNELDFYLDRSDIELVAISLDQFYSAQRAWHRFGKGNHAAKLNFGDCFAYALAEVMGEPLLFKGLDFAQTDITAAVSI
ncbi:MAG: type II toxin-antitoxin system VapC family toxin [Gammaproteobacteria bacterium]|nr:type II toxin-antitoxin system VapC family toxin [Gammaproteobacteria bacterium]